MEWPTRDAAASRQRGADEPDGESQTFHASQIDLYQYSQMPQKRVNTYLRRKSPVQTEKERKSDDPRNKPLSVSQSNGQATGGELQADTLVTLPMISSRPCIDKIAEESEQGRSSEHVALTIQIPDHLLHRAPKQPSKKLNQLPGQSVAVTAQSPDHHFYRPIQPPLKKLQQPLGRPVASTAQTLHHVLYTSSKQYSNELQHSQNKFVATEEHPKQELKQFQQPPRQFVSSTAKSPSDFPPRSTKQHSKERQQSPRPFSDLPAEKSLPTPQKRKKKLSPQSPKQPSKEFVNGAPLPPCLKIPERVLREAPLYSPIKTNIKPTSKSKILPTKTTETHSVSGETDVEVDEVFAVSSYSDSSQKEFLPNKQEKQAKQKIKKERESQQEKQRDRVSDLQKPTYYVEKVIPVSQPEAKLKKGNGAKERLKDMETQPIFITTKDIQIHPSKDEKELPEKKAGIKIESKHQEAKEPVMPRDSKPGDSVSKKMHKVEKEIYVGPQTPRSDKLKKENQEKVLEDQRKKGELEQDKETEGRPLNYLLPSDTEKLDEVQEGPVEDVPKNKKEKKRYRTSITIQPKINQKSSAPLDSEDETVKQQQDTQAETATIISPDDAVSKEGLRIKETPESLEEGMGTQEKLQLMNGEHLKDRSINERREDIEKETPKDKSEETEEDKRDQKDMPEDSKDNGKDLKGKIKDLEAETNNLEDETSYADNKAHESGDKSDATDKEKINIPHDSSDGVSEGKYFEKDVEIKSEADNLQKKEQESKGQPAEELKEDEARHPSADLIRFDEAEASEDFKKQEPVNLDRDVENQETSGIPMKQRSVSLGSGIDDEKTIDDSENEMQRAVSLDAGIGDSLLETDKMSNARREKGKLSRVESLDYNQQCKQQ